MAGTTGSITSHSGERMQYRCSFCGKWQDQVKRLIAGPGAVYICDECVELCSDIVAEEAPESGFIPQAQSASCGFCGKENDAVPFVLYGPELHISDADWRYSPHRFERHHIRERVQQRTICSECIDAYQQIVVEAKSDKGEDLINGRLIVLPTGDVRGNVIPLMYACSFCGRDREDVPILFAKIDHGCICSNCLDAAANTITAFERAAQEPISNEWAAP
jgi:hypothetical protein